MGYIGQSPQIAQSRYQSIDDISSSFDGSTTSFALQVGGVSPVPFPVASENCLISVGGVIQEPDGTGTNGFQLTGTNIVFSAAPASGQSFFGVILAGADYVSVGTAFPDGDAGTPSITFNQDLDTGLFRGGSGITSVSSNNNKIADFGPTAIVFNEDGDDVDFRVEGDTKANLFVVDAGNDKITLDGDLEPTTIHGEPFPTAGALSNRNLIINGGMKVAQRGTSVTGVGVDDFTSADRFKQFAALAGQAGRCTATQENITDLAGFNKALKLQVTTSETPGSTESYGLNTRLELQDIKGLGVGTSAAVPLTLSFYAKAPTGNGVFCAGIIMTGGGSYIEEVTIGTSWSRHEINIPATTNSAHATTQTSDVGNAMEIQITLMAGSSRDDHGNGTWEADTTNRATSNQSNFYSSTSNNLFITGVQLERGEKATPFEHRSYGDELQRCLRYTYVLGSQNPTDNFERFDMGIANSSTGTRIFIKHPVVMRTAPTVSTPDASQFQVSDTMNGYDASALSRQGNANGPLHTSLQITHASGTTSSRPYIFERNDSTSGRITFSAEL